MNKDVWIAGVIVLACFGLVITALFIPKKENKAEHEQHVKSNYSVKQADMFM